MKPPNHFSDESKKTWRKLVAEYEFGPDALLTLRAGLECWDRAQQARALVASEGLVLNGRRHPAVDVEKQAYGLFMRAMRQLGLDIVPPGERSPGIL